MHLNILGLQHCQDCASDKKNVWIPDDTSEARTELETILPCHNTKQYSSAKLKVKHTIIRALHFRNKCKFQI